MANLTDLIAQTLLNPAYSVDVKETPLKKRIFDVLNENLLAENKTYDISWTAGDSGNREKITKANCEQLNFKSEAFSLGPFEYVQYFIINNIILILISAGTFGYVMTKVRSGTLLVLL